MYCINTGVLDSGAGFSFGFSVFYCVLKGPLAVLETFSSLYTASNSLQMEC